MVKINNLEELKNLCPINDSLSVSVRFESNLRSSKTIYRGINSWSVYNDIDDSEDEYDTEEEFLESFVIKAMNNGNLYMY